jgi:hypothetical protein
MIFASFHQGKEEKYIYLFFSLYVVGKSGRNPQTHNIEVASPLPPKQPYN